MLLYMTDDERHTVPEIAAEDVTAALRILEKPDLVGSHMRLVDGKGVEFWQIFWHRADRKK
jgi:hypothetical protein